MNQKERDTEVTAYLWKFAKVIAPWGGAQGPDCPVSRTQVAPTEWEPLFSHTACRTGGGIVTWLVIGTVAFLVILAAAPLIHGCMPYGTGPFAKD